MVDWLEGTLAISDAVWRGETQCPNCGGKLFVRWIERPGVLWMCEGCMTAAEEEPRCGAHWKRLVGELMGRSA